MQPINIIIREHLADRVIDIEDISAKLEHHGYTVSIDNAFCSDTGDHWKCELYYKDDITDDDNPGIVSPGIRVLEPSLRTAVLKALDLAAAADEGRKAVARQRRALREIEETATRAALPIPAGSRS